MNMYIARLFCLFILLNSIYATETNGDNEKETDREPRVNGRIVKLYSGTRPEPIYCPREGFQADPTNCAVFYRCVKGASNKFTVFRFQCGPGTVYDPDTEVCNFPQSTRRSECGGILLPSSVDRNNENEIEGLRPELPTPINIRPVYPPLSNENTMHTMYPWATPKPESSQSKFTNSWMTSISYQDSSKKDTSHQSQPTRQESNTCTKDGFMGDSENCRKFYRCVGNQRGHYIRYEFSCSETTVWDDEVQSCNHPWAVQRSRCGRSDSDSNSSPEGPSNHPHNNQTPSKSTVQEQLQINYGEKVTQTQSQINYGQVIQNQTQINYGDRNTNKSNSQVKQNQTQINYGSAVSQTQTQINYGNGVQTQLQIDHTKESSQAQVQNYETTSTTTTTGILQDEINHGYGMQTSTQEYVNKDQNNNECTESGFMGDQNDCKKFYRCVDNGRGNYIKYEFSCGEGTVWDSSIEACNHAWAVKECGGKVPESSTQGVSQTTMKTSTQDHQTTSEVTTIDHSEDSGYGNPNQQSEMTTTTTTKLPNYVSTTTLGSSSSVGGSKCASTGFKEDPNDCKKFYRCVDNGNGGYTKYEFSCGEGTVWDQDIEACNHPWAVKKCGSTESGTNIIETTSAQSTDITVSLEQTSTQSSSENVDTGYNQQPSESSLNVSTTEQPQINENNKCTSSGFMGDNNDCKKFYRCVDNGNGGYTRYEFSCGEGTVWDPKIEACNHAWAVEKCGVDDSDTLKETTSSAKPTTTDIHSTQSSASPSQSTSQPTTANPSLKKECSQEGFMGDESDCKKFYRCVDNGQGGFIKYEFSCGEGTVWDTEITACNHPSSNKHCDVSGAQNSGTQISTEPNRENDEQYTESTNSVETSTKDTQTTMSNQSLQASDDKCKTEGFYADSKNCKKFYRCVDNGKGSYTKYEFTCGDGTIWDQEIQACNHEPNDSKCSKDTETSPPATATTEGEIATLPSTNQPTQTQITSGEPSGRCTSEGFYANTNDCKKFYRCVDDGKGAYTKYDFSCGEGTMWVQEIQACDHASGESCTSYSSSTTETITVESPSDSSVGNSTIQQPDKQDDESPIETSSDSSALGSSESSDKCTAEGFYPNKNDCKHFYRCVDNSNGGYTKYDFSCGEGTAWDSDIQSCNHISEVKSCKSQEQAPSPPMQDEEALESPSSTSSGTTQSSTSGPATESSKPSNKDTCDKEGYYGNSEDCTKFYRCVDNGKGGFTKYDFSCGEGTIWDQDITACNHPQDVTNPSCQQSNNSDSSSSSTTSSSSSTSGSSSSTTDSGSSDCSQSSTKKPDSKNVNCTKAGYYPDPNDCKKFYRCVDWDGDGKRFSVYHFECGEGTIWDPALDTCNHEDSVYPPRDCTKESQGENVDQESSTTEQTTTQGSTSEHTTQESPTEKTTTEKSTTSEQTTSQQTTTQESPTEKTTTEKSTTSEQTTSQQTTTQESPTEKTTTEKSTTTEQTTSEQTTTQITTTNEQPTTSEQTTIAKQTTSQETTTEQTTTQQTTSQHTTTEQTMTQESTTQESTTEQSGTTEHTSSTTENDQQSTTKQTTDTEGNSTESTTTEGTTEQSTTTDESDITENSTSTTTTSSSTTAEQEMTTTESSSESSQNNTSNQECPTTDDDQNIFVCPTSFRRHPKYCNMFYQCTEDDDTHDIQIATFHCPNNTIYDESKTQCVDEKKADKKCDGELAKKRRLKRLTIYKEPIVVTNERLKCPSPGHYPFEQGECSPAFLKCQKTKTGKIRGFVYQCPEEYVYWAVSRRCEQKKHVRDCKQSNNDWKGRWEIPIERRNVAP